MRIRSALLCVCLGWPLGGWGADLAAVTGQADTNVVVPRPDPEGIYLKSAGDVTNITEYLQEKFRIPAQPVLAPPPGSNDVATADGRIYRNVQVWKIEPDGLTLRHAEGLDKVEFPLLPEAWQKKYEYDPEMAAAYQRAVAAAFAEAERNQRILRGPDAAAPAKPMAEESR